MKKGLWASPTEFRNFSAVDKVGSLSAEIATRQQSIDFYSLGMYLPNPDPVLKKMNKNIKVYREILSDAFVRGCVTSLKSGVKSLLWEVDRGKAKSRQAKFISDAVKALDIKRMISEAIDAYLYGYEVSEVMWDPATWTPDDVVGKPPEWFVFDAENNLKFRTRVDWNGIDLPDRKFLLTRYEPTYQNPYGFPTLSTCFWPSTFRKGGYKFWVTFAEKFGMPFVIGKHPRGIDQKEISDLADMLENMVQDAIAAIPDDSSIEIMGQSIKGEATIYYSLIEACKTEISIALLGHTAGAISTPGKLGGEDQAVKVREDVIDDIKGMVETKFNTLIEWISFYNFAERVELPTFNLFQEEDVDKDQADRDKTLADTGQIRFKKPYFMKTYGFEDEDIDVIVAPTPQKPGITGAGDTGGDGGTVNLTKNDEETTKFAKSASEQQLLQTMPNPEELQTLMEGVLRPVIDLINSGTGYEDIMKELVTAYPNMDITALQEMLARAIFVAECWGRMNSSS